MRLESGKLSQILIGPILRGLPIPLERRELLLAPTMVTAFSLEYIWRVGEHFM